MRRVRNRPASRWLAMVLVGLIWGALVGAGRAEPGRIDVLLVAHDEATGLLRKELSQTHHETEAAWELWTGQLAGKSVALTDSDGDPLNAVAATTIALSRHPARLVVVLGTARAHDPSLRPGDIVVSSEFAAFDGMYSPVREPGEGIHPLAWMPEPHLLMTAGERETPMNTFPADENAAAAALRVKLPGHRIVAGILGSANQVNHEADRIAWLRQHWKTSTEDGESAHVAGCAYLLGVPVVGIRVIDGSVDEAVSVVSQFLEGWQ